jgi:hypothetical protein
MAEDTSVIRYDDPSQLPAAWQMSEKAIEAFNVAKSMVATSGMYANIPIICKGIKCPFIETCSMKAVGMDVEELKGQRCPIEIADVLKRFQWYIQHLEIDQDNVVDLGMVKEIVDIDIMLERASRRMASEGDFVEMVVVGMDPEGNPLRRPEIRKSVDFKERMSKRKDTLLSLLNSTRKDKAGSKVTIDMDPSTYAATLLARKKELDAAKANDGIIVDLEPTEVIEVGEDNGKSV